MAFMNDYQAAGIKPAIVSKEGVYAVKIVNASVGKMEDGKRFIRVETMINADGYPALSLFLTEGEKFNGVATAFFDTFGLQRNSWNFETWKGAIGHVNIKLKEKNGYMNMIPSYILDEHGFVVRQQQQNQQQQYQQYQQAEQYSPDIPEGIIF